VRESKAAHLDTGLCLAYEKRILVACRGEFVSAEAAGEIGIFPTDGLCVRCAGSNDGGSNGLQPVFAGVKDARSASMRISLARKTYPAGKERDGQCC
jgi:hypothetical protein